MWVAWAALALATLVQGIDRHRAAGRRAGRVHAGHARLGALATAAPGLRARCLLGDRRAVVRRGVGRNPEFFDFFFIHEHFTRFLTGEHRREGAWWYFVPIFVVGILPWLAVFVVDRDANVDRRAERDANGFNWQRFALVWSAVIFVFFSAVRLEAAVLHPADLPGAGAADRPGN